MSSFRHIVVVTGASQGIGAAIARAFAAAPETAIALVSRNAPALERVAADCRTSGTTAEVFPCDVTDADAVGAMASAVIERFGRPTALVNNAGAFVPGGVLDFEPDAFRAQIDVNLNSAFLVTRAFLPGMLEQRSGHLFYMASVASIRGYAGGAAYCAAKHGLLGLARAVREETGSKGLRVTTLLPGPTWTPSWDGIDQPEDRFMPAEDIAEAVLAAYRFTGRTVAEEILLRPQLGDL